MQRVHLNLQELAAAGGFLEVHLCEHESVVFPVVHSAAQAGAHLGGDAAQHH